MLKNCHCYFVVSIKMIDPRDMNQAKGQNIRSKALKFITKSWKLKNIRKLIRFVLIIFSELFELQRHAIPHFRALDPLF